MLKISIIIPTYQEENFIEATLKQFAALTIPHELIVTDGGSTDKTLEIVKKYTSKVVVWDRAAKGRRQTFGEAKNMGAALATGEFFVFIDADVVVPKPQEFFEAILGYFASHPRTVAVTTPFAPTAPSILDTVGMAPVNVWFLFLNNALGMGQASGEFQMIRAGIFKKLGGYREDLTAVEDVDMFQRLAKVGRTHSYWKLSVQHSFRRIHALGWPRTYWLWVSNGLMYQVKNRATAKEWEVIR